MAIPPPPYDGISGIFIQINKHDDCTLANYDGNARPGQLVVDSSDWSLYVGNSDGILNPITGAGTSGYSGFSGYSGVNGASGYSGFSGAPGSATDNIANGTSNVSIATSNGNVTVSVGGTPNVAVFTTTGTVTSGNLTLASTLAQEGGTPLSATDTTITYKIPIVINSVTYYIALTTAQ